MATVAAETVETLSEIDRRLFERPTPCDVAINPLLHKRLRVKAAETGDSIKGLAEEALWKIVGGKPKGEK